MDINTRFILIRADEHGTKFLICRAITEREAKEALDALLANQEKVHHQTYDIVPYELGTLTEFCDRHKILR